MEESNDDVAPVGIVESFIINQSSPRPQLYNNFTPYNQEDKLFIMEKKIEEQGKQILELQKENLTLKRQLTEACQNIISIYNNMNKYNKIDLCMNKLNQIQLNFSYNSLDNQLFKLEQSFKTINHDIITTRSEFGLINAGVKRQLKKNILKCTLKYKASFHGKKPEVFHAKCDNLLYQLLVIKTTNERRFGVFFCNNKNNSFDENLYNSYNNGFNNNYFLYSSLSSRDIHSNSNLSVEFLDLKNDNGNEIFNCSTKPEKFFAFSLNNAKIYFKTQNNKVNVPCFSIYYDINRESYYGKERKVAINSQIIGHILSGKEEFNILEFEVYEIEI